MKTETFESIYNSPTDIQDVPEHFLTGENPLYIGAREGQVTRVRKLLDESGKKGFALGWWELEKLGYITEVGGINRGLFKSHGYVCAAAPERVVEEARFSYEKLLWVLKSL